MLNNISNARNLLKGIIVETPVLALTEDEIRRVHLPPYLEAIKAGVKTVMISFNSWNGVQCHGNKFLINDILQH